MTTSVASSNNAPLPVETASGWLALLQEPDPVLQSHALEKLLGCVDLLWHEVAQALPELEALAEDGSTTAAAVASRVFFHLGEPQQALRLALEAGTLLDGTSMHSPYHKRLTRAALDAYIRHQQGTPTELDLQKLQSLVQQLVRECTTPADALGICLETRQADQCKHILTNNPALCQETLKHLQLVSSKAFRVEILQVIATCLTDTDVDLKVLVHQMLHQPQPVADVLVSLLNASDDDALLAYQVCFDLQDAGDVAFLHQVNDCVATSFAQDAEENARWLQCKRILVGGFSSELALSFLHKQSHADRLIMELLKKTLEERGSGGRNSILHNAAVMTHAYLYAGTTNDSFLRDYLDWMKKASNWAKFSATASLGVVHAGHITEAMNLLEPYLPPAVTEETAVSPSGGYAEGGSLFALGLIHGAGSPMRAETCDLLRTHLRASHANEVISHGAALGVGLTAMGSNDLTILNELKELLYTDSAVAGEAAGMAIGMVLVGSGDAGTGEVSELVSELKNYARETQHEKIIRGIAMGLALINYGQEEAADALIEEMRSDRDPILRYGAQYSLALAYCGTGSNKAIRILLHTAVSDVSDDVRMAAVIGLAFVLHKTPERVPQLVKLLLESFNPHVRYASCMAVGIAMSGTGNAESLALLEPMLEDMTDYVRQGALMGSAMIYMQQSDSAKKIRSFRERLSSIIKDKHQSTMTKMGAILSKGILDAGGRNCSLVLGSAKHGFTKMKSVIGLTMWLQHWHWFPMMHMFSMALTPTYTVGLNKDLKYPKGFEIVCNSKPSVYAYPKKMEEKKEEKKKRVETVTLSTTAKNKARLARKKAKEGGDSSMMDVEEIKAEEEEKKEEEKEEEEEKKPRKKVPEPTSFRIPNPARITKAQSANCVFDLQQRYRPIRSEQGAFGVVMLTDSTPTEVDNDLGAVKAPSLEPEGECAPPEPFEWTAPEEETKVE